jgi:hypothetical protein
MRSIGSVGTIDRLCANCRTTFASSSKPQPGLQLFSSNEISAPSAIILIGHGVRAKRAKSGAITFELLNAEDGHAAV